MAVANTDIQKNIPAGKHPFLARLVALLVCSVPASVRTPGSALVSLRGSESFGALLEEAAGLIWPASPAEPFGNHVCLKIDSVYRS